MKRLGESKRSPRPPGTGPLGSAVGIGIPPGFNPPAAESDANAGRSSLPVNGEKFGRGPGAGSWPSAQTRPRPPAQTIPGGGGVRGYAPGPDNGFRDHVTERRKEKEEQPSRRVLRRAGWGVFQGCAPSHMKGSCPGIADLAAKTEKGGSHAFRSPPQWLPSSAVAVA